MEPEPVDGYSIEKTPSGEYYYVNEETGETQWERPVPSPVIGYTLHNTPGGAHYYVHNITGEWFWERPQPDLSVPPPPPDSAIQDMGGDRDIHESSISGLTPEPWMENFEDRASEGADLSIAKIAILAMVFSITLPFLSIGDGLITYSGVDILEDWYDLAEFIVELGDDTGAAGECQYANDGICDEPLYCATGTDGNDCADSGSSASGSFLDEVPIRVWLLAVAGFMLLLSPIFLLISGGISGFSVFSTGVLPKLMGKIHLSFFGVMFMLLLIGGTILDDVFGDLGFSIIDTIGIGIWIGALSGLGLIYEK